MKVGDLSGGAAKLEQAMDTLRNARHDAAERWDDETFRQFDQRYFEPLEARYRRALDAIRRLAQVLDRAQRECGPISEQ